MIHLGRFLLVLLGTFFLSNIYAQDLTISGGNTVSAVICANGKVFTWGSNQGGTNGSITGTLGTGNTTDATINNPSIDANSTAGRAEVQFPTTDPFFNSLGSSITVRQVDAGSGAHFVALDCESGVWSWGNNTYSGNMGITGTGSTAQALTVPARVLRGETPGGAGPLANFLTDVVYISGGNNSSYAILASQELVAWGENTVGQLGNGANTNSATPVYVQTPDGQRLTNVVNVEAGDNMAYALVDPDGDGIGTIYSWGGGTGTFGAQGLLGRSADGTRNNGTEADNDNFARPVLRLDGTPLDNIVSMSAGDVACLAIDEEGFVWAWGNGGNGGITGAAPENIGDHSDPKRVLAGEWGVANGETFLKAKVVSGGQSYSMAVTITGEPVAWGINGAFASQGGNLGDGTTDGSFVPVFIRRNATTVDDNVVSISDGDTWGFYTTDANEIYTWGANQVGQLGIGNTDRQAFATRFELPPCSFPDPLPRASLSPRDFEVCSAAWSGAVLESGFSIATSLESSYEIEWFRDGVSVNIGDGSNTSFSATLTGVYRVEVRYVGSSNPCTAYLPAIDEIEISEYVQNFSPTPDLEFCGDNFTASVDGVGRYNWFATNTSTDVLGTSVRNEEVSFGVANVTEVTGDTYTVYAEEIGGKHGIIGDKAAKPCTDSKEEFDGTVLTSIITAYTDLRIDSALFYHSGSNNGSTQTSNWEVCVWDVQNVRGSLVADKTREVACGPVVNLPSHDGVDVFEPYAIPVEIDLMGIPAGVQYAIGLKQAPNRIETFDCTPGFPYTDDVAGGDYLSITGYEERGNPPNLGEEKRGIFSWIEFTTIQEFCTRIPVEVTLNCPCNKPSSVTASTAGACEGVDVVLEGAFDDAGFPVVNTMSFAWYKQGNPPTAATDYTTLAPGGVTDFNIPTADAVNEDVYILRVQDGTDPSDATCYTEGQVELAINQLPDLDVTDPNAVCAPNTVDITTTFTDNNNTSGTVTYHSDVTATDANELTNEGAISVTGEYFVKSSNEGCEDVESVNVTINALPEAPVLSTISGFCIDSEPTDVAIAINNAITASGTLTFYEGTTVVTDLNARLTALVGTVGDTEFSVSQTTTGCEGPRADFTVSIISEPSVDLSVDDLIICEGEDVVFTANSSATGNSPTYTFKNLAGDVLPGSVDNVYSVANVTAVLTVVVEVVSTSSCTGTFSDTATVRTVAPPVVTITNPASNPQFVSQDELIGANALVATTNIAEYEVVWEIETGQGALTSPTSKTTNLTGLNTFEPDPETGVGTTDIFVVSSDTSGVCPTDTARITIIRKDGIIPFIADARLCASTDLPYQVIGNEVGVNETPTIIDINDASGTGTINFPNENELEVVNPGISTDSADFLVVYQIENTVTNVVLDDTATIRIYSDPSVVNAGIVDPICVSTAVLDATPLTIGSGKWTCVAESPERTALLSIDDDTRENTTVRGIEENSMVTCTWTVTNGVCTAVDDVEIERVGSITEPEILLNGIVLTDTATICIDEMNSLSGATPISPEVGVWAIDNTTGSFGGVSGNNPDQGLITASFADTTTLTWTISNPDIPSCSPESTSATIVVVDKPVVNIITADTVICADGSSVLNLVGEELTGQDVTLQWYNNGTEVLNETDLTLVDVTETGSYTLGADNGVCMEEISNDVFADIRPIPEVTILGNQPIIGEFDDPSLSLSADVRGLSITSNPMWFWELSDSLTISLVDPADLNTGIVATAGGAYLATLRVQDGPCLTSEEVVILLRAPIRAPNVFTPNGDGENDEFFIEGVDTYENANVLIFNRWGVTIYQTENYNQNRWKAEGAPDGVYYYLVILDESESASADNHTGVIHVIR